MNIKTLLTVAMMFVATQALSDPRVIQKPMPYDIAIGDIINIGPDKTGNPIMSHDSFKEANVKFYDKPLTYVVKKGEVVTIIIGS